MKRSAGSADERGDEVAARPEFGAVLRRLRLAAGISQEELAERASLSVEGISALERGRRRAPYRDTVRLLGEALHLSDTERHELAAAAQRLRPVAPGSALRHNLPEQANALIGREPELARLQALSETTRMLTITGAGGIGKTRIALELAYVLRAALACDIWFVDLAPLSDATLIAATMAATIGATPRAARSMTETIVSHIGDTAVVLIVDNCEHVVDEVGEIVEAILRSCVNVRIVATSREALRIAGEFVFRLPSLSVPPTDFVSERDDMETFGAVALFVERAKAINGDLRFSGATLIDVAHICRRLDGIPLAIELAAAQAQTVSIADLRWTLHRTFKILTARHRGTLPRQQTLHALIDWGFALLSDREKTLFVRLAVFAGGWTLDAVATVCADDLIEEDDVVDALFSLVHKSLVVANLAGSASRYRLLEATRMYASEKLSLAERVALERRHARWVAGFSVRAYDLAWTMAQHDWQPTVAAELDNVRLALRNALAGDEPVLAAQIAGNLANLWHEGGLPAEGRRWIEAALERYGPSADPTVVCRLRLALAKLSTGKRIVDECEAAMALFDALPSSRDRADVYFTLSFGLFQVGRLQEALTATDRAMTFMIDSGLAHTRRFADTVDTRANVLLALGRYDQARLAFGESYNVFALLNEEHGMARAQGNLAELEFACDHADRALELTDQAATVFERFGAVARLATARVNGAAYMLVLGKIEQACETALEALDLARRAQDTLLSSVAVQRLATVLALRDQPKRSAILLGYVQMWFETEGYVREASEQKIHDLLMTSLSSQLSPADIQALEHTGSLMSEEQAVEAARRFILEMAE